MIKNPQLIIFALIFFLGSCSHVSSPKHSGISILQGLTTENTVEFSILIHKNGQGKFTVINPKGETLSPDKMEIISRPYSDWSIHKIHFSNLLYSPEVFKLSVEDTTGNRDLRTFKLFANTGDKLRFAVASCADSRQMSKQKPMWAAIAASNPEWLFLIGDNIYANQNSTEVTDEKELWERYIEARQHYDLYFLPQLIPTYAVWDDNDYGQKDGNSSFALKDISATVFNTFYAQSFEAELYNKGPGIAGRLDLRGMHFTFLDNRTFRELDTNGSHFGTDQEKWLFDDMQSSQLPTWIISGDQFFGGYHDFDSFEGKHPQAFENFLKKLKEISTPFVFVSGDRHMTEVMQFPRALLGQLSFEFTASPIFGKIYPGRTAELANPWRVIQRDDSLNFMLINTSLSNTGWNINLESVGPAGVLFNRDLSLTTEALKDFTIEKRQRRRRYRRARWRKR